MQNVPIVPLVVMAILLIVVLAVAAFVVLRIGRIIICLIQGSRAARRPVRELQHPELGAVTFDSSLWTGRIRNDGRDVQFIVAGTESGPDTRLVGQLRSSLERLAELEQMALAFLCHEEPKVRPEDFRFDSIDWLWIDKPEQFAMEFTLAGDDSGIWRVEFDNGRPRYCGRDD